MAKRSAAFGSALRAVRVALGLSQEDFGTRLGVSRRTLTRWEIHDELPPIGQRKHIATSFSDAPPQLRVALIRSLELGDGFVVSVDPPQPPPAPAPPPGPAPTSAEQAAIVDGAFLELCERADVAPGRLRAGLVAFLQRLEASDLSLEATRAQLEPKNRVVAASSAPRKASTRGRTG